MKKLSSIFLAMVMMFALAIPALATETNGLEYEYEYAGTQEEMEIKLVLPGAMNIVLNPYKMVHSATSDETYYVDKLADQLFSTPKTIKSKSNVALKVGMTITGMPEGGVTLVDAEDQATDNDNAEGAKNVYMAMQYGLTDKANATPTAATQMPDFVVLSTARDLTDAQMVTMPIGATTEQYLSIVFTGAANDKPDEAYTSEDKVNVNIAYTFIPVMSEEHQLKVAEVFDQSEDVTVEIPDSEWFYTSDEDHNEVSFVSPADIHHPAEGNEDDDDYVAPYDDIALASKVFTIKKEYIAGLSDYTTANAAAAPTNNTAAKNFVIVIPITLSGDVKTSAAEATTPTYDVGVQYTYNVRIVCDYVASEGD